MRAVEAMESVYQGIKRIEFKLGFVLLGFTKYRSSFGLTTSQPPRPTSQPTHTLTRPPFSAIM